MASIKTTQRKDGSSSFTVCWRDPQTRREQGITFDSRGEAETLKLGVELDLTGEPLDVAVRRSINLTERDRRIVRAVLTAMRAEERGGNVSTAPITRAAESPAEQDVDAYLAKLTDAQLERLRNQLVHGMPVDYAPPAQEDVDLAAYDTCQESEGRRLRRMQDEAAEEGE